jgi:hypothetical protein
MEYKREAFIGCFDPFSTVKISKANLPIWGTVCEGFWSIILFQNDDMHVNSFLFGAHFFNAYGVMSYENGFKVHTQ